MTIKNLLCDEKLLNVSHIYGDEAFKGQASGRTEIWFDASLHRKYCVYFSWS
jgi:hypothetical protein